MNRTFKAFGTGTVVVNDLPVHYVKVRISLNASNCREMEKEGFIAHPTFVKVKGKNDSKEMLEFRLTTTDGLEFSRYVARVGRVLKAVALNNVQDKYAWVDLQGAMDRELDMP